MNLATSFVLLRRWSTCDIVITKGRYKDFGALRSQTRPLADAAYPQPRDLGPHSLRSRPRAEDCG
jgi:hypothetical protein